MDTNLQLAAALHIETNRTSAHGDIGGDASC